MKFLLPLLFLALVVFVLGTTVPAMIRRKTRNKSLLLSSKFWLEDNWNALAVDDQVNTHALLEELKKNPHNENAKFVLEHIADIGHPVGHEHGSKPVLVA